MALTRAQFIARFPEFTSTDTDTVDARLDDAEDAIDTSVWGDHYDRGHGFLTADLLAMSGYGSKEVPKDGVTAYRRAFDDLEARVSLVHLAVV